MEINPTFAAMDVAQVAISVIGGFVAGVINTLAGSGSAITLPILTELIGLPGNIANGTNRIGIALQTVSSSVTFQKANILGIREQIRPLVFSVSGAFAGIALALWVSNDQFMAVFRYMMVAMFLIVLVRPKKWIHPDPEKSQWPQPFIDIAFFLIGVYGGFIQMGMGIFFLVVAVLGAKLTLLKANIIKVMAVGLYTVPAIVIFALNGQIEWIYGLTIGAGQLLGGWLTARYAVRFPGINTYAYYALLIAVLLSLLSVFDLI